MANESYDAVEGGRGKQARSSLVLCAGFSLTGAATVMLGVVLPALMQRWEIHDDAAGFLFFLQFLGSSLGAICTGANYNRSLRTGYGLLVASSGALGFAGLRASFALFFFFGLGLGMAMTATSLIFSERYGEDRAAKLEGLNFAWALGATAAPILFAPFLHAANLRSLFFAFQGLFLLLFIWMFFQERPAKRRLEAVKGPPPRTSSASLHALLPLVGLAMCAVGAESSLSGWLTTYSHRTEPMDVAREAIAVSIFWLGILLSRLATSTSLLAWVGRRRMLDTLLVGAAASVALLMSAHHAPVIRVAAALAGLSIGPLYPLILSYLLERTSRGWIFAAGGLGSAIFPWLTGVLSTQLGSLRFGLIAPCGAALLMIALRSASLRPPSTESIGISPATEA